MNEMLENNWTGLYREGWGTRLRPASYAHPAKNSYGLSVRIYEHALEEGWVKAGDYVVDCFSGVGGFALEAMRNGLHFRGVELEMRFVDMGQGCDCTGISKADWVRYQGRWDKMRYENGRHWCPECLMKASAVADEWKNAIADKRKIKPLPLPGTKWAALAKMRQVTVFDAAPSTSYVRNSGKIPCTGTHRYHGNIETWERQGMAGTAVIIQGDSRRLGEVLARARLCLSSPPYSTGGIHRTKAGFDRQDWMKGNDEGRTVWSDGKPRRVGKSTLSDYGSDPANLGNLPDTGFEAALAVSSPAWHKVVLHDGGPVQQQGGELHSDYGSEPGQLAQMPEGSFDLALSSPVYIGNTASDDPDKRGGLYRDPKRRNDKTLTATYSEDAAQLAQMPEGDLALALGSPPYVAISLKPNATSKKGAIPSYKYYRVSKKQRIEAGINDAETPYGQEPGQLAALPEGDHAEALEAGAVTPACAATADRGRAQACISSPPHMSTTCRGAQDPTFAHKFRGNQRYSDEDPRDPKHTLGGDRNSPEATAAREARAAATHNLGEIVVDSGATGLQHTATFWAASRTILEQVYQVLAPGGHCIWVLKMFVRSGRLVDFPGQWETLCQSVGFKTVCKHRAWMNKNTGIVQTTLDGEEMSMEKWYKSFFRILCEKKGAPRIDWELILCMVKE